MRLPCYLRRLRERRGLTLREMEDLTGIHRGQLSRYEQGRELVLDKHQVVLEEVYDAPADFWYPPAVLLLIERDGGAG